MKISVLFCIDDGFWQHLGVAITSLLRSNVSHVFRIIIVSASEPRADDVDRIKTVVDSFGNGAIEIIVFQEAANYRQLPVSLHFSFAIYLRLFMTEYLPPDLDKILYLDGDLVVCDDIGDLWGIDLSNTYIAAAPEPYDFPEKRNLGFGPGDLYINSGVMLINLLKWRSEMVLRTFMEFANEHLQAIQGDQDIINVVFRGKIHSISYRWNWQAILPCYLPHEIGLSIKEFYEIRRSPAIVHFSHQYKPWFYQWEPHYKKLYYEVVALTPWAGYVPPDRSIRGLPTRLVRLMQRRLEWHLPRSVRLLRKMPGDSSIPTV